VGVKTRVAVAVGGLLVGVAVGGGGVEVKVGTGVGVSSATATWSGSAGGGSVWLQAVKIKVINKKIIQIRFIFFS
jgi:hypothetical protein